MNWNLAKCLKIRRWFGPLIVAASACSARAQGVVVVPDNLYTVAGNTNSWYPFGTVWPYTSRYQEVYAASQFTNAANAGDLAELFAGITNGGWISDLYFRVDSNSQGVAMTVSNAEIHLSTTTRPPGGLSPVFSENIGLDDTLVFSGSVTLGYRDAWGLNHIALSTNFWYDPTKGNLLMDVRMHHGVDSPIPRFDAEAAPAGSVSSITAPYSVDATNGTVDITGLVTFIAMAPPPFLHAYVSSNYFVVSWFNQPPRFVLQESASLGNNPLWQTLPGTGSTNVAISEEYRVPLTGAVRTSFFRLAVP